MAIQDERPRLTSMNGDAVQLNVFVLVLLLLQILEFLVKIPTHHIALQYYFIQMRLPFSDSFEEDIKTSTMYCM